MKINVTKHLRSLRVWRLTALHKRGKRRNTLRLLQVQRDVERPPPRIPLLAGCSFFVVFVFLLSTNLKRSGCLWSLDSLEKLGVIEILFLEAWVIHIPDTPALTQVKLPENRKTLVRIVKRIMCLYLSVRLNHHSGPGWPVLTNNGWITVKSGADNRGSQVMDRLPFNFIHSLASVFTEHLW